jgi:hypothetical protein
LLLVGIGEQLAHSLYALLVRIVEDDVAAGS